VPAAIDAVDDRAVPITATPLMRGWLHTWMFFALIPAGVLLVAVADRTSARIAATIYVASLLALFGTSAAYHRLTTEGKRSRVVMQRLDHSMIYLLIAGTYVPMCVIVLPRAWGIPMLAVVVAAAVLGIVLKVTAFQRTRWLSYSLYPLMGWVAIIAAPVLVRELTPLQLVLIVAGGVAYTAGMPILLTRRPNPWPATFGYHELWHAFTVVAAALHFAAVSVIVA
jgi:hemolysin III